MNWETGIDIYILHCQSLSRVQLFVTPWTAAHQAPLSTEFSRQEYWSKLPCPSPGDLPDPGIEPGFPALQVDSLPSEPQGNSSVICSIRGSVCMDKTYWRAQWTLLSALRWPQGKVRNGVFPVVSVNKDVTVISDCSPPLWALRALRKEEKSWTAVI